MLELNRVYCGDCLELMKHIPDGSIDAVITDPPYGISYQSSRKTDSSKRFDILHGDNSVPTQWLNEAFRVTGNVGCLFCFCRWDTQEIFRKAIVEAGWNLKSQVIWDRGIHGLGDLKAQYAPTHDNVWFAIKGDYSFSGKRPKSVLRSDRLPACDLTHPTQKPIQLMKMIVDDLTYKQQTILDPFLGSGTTAVACIQTGRNFIGFEIDPDYCAIAERRIKEAQAQCKLELV